MVNPTNGFVKSHPRVAVNGRRVVERRVSPDSKGIECLRWEVRHGRAGLGLVGQDAGSGGVHVMGDRWWDLSRIGKLEAMV